MGEGAPVKQDFIFRRLINHFLPPPVKYFMQAKVQIYGVGDQQT